MSLIAARIVAVPVSVWLVGAPIFDADYRADSIFAAPDLVFSLVLLVGAALPTATSVPVLITGFLFGSGVVTIAALERLDHNETPQAILDFVVAAVYLVTAVTLIHRRSETVPTAG
ncbi:hypothetical protein [Nocardia brevicatena]|uniref:hypothetical protein n=1 Tax=Nocardia brevicatena TaxID=37327 RepID=UPI00031CC875|nr:hypothetical protein [Nocardia brevicatena]